MGVTMSKPTATVIGVPACVPCVKMPKRFTLTQAIKAKRALRIAERFGSPSFAQRMTGAKAAKVVNATFKLS